MNKNGNGHSKMNLKEWKNKILNEGVDINSQITSMKIKETYFVRDGNHRTFGSALAGKTLIPYEVKWQEDTPYTSKDTAGNFIRKYIFGDIHYDRELYEYETFLSKIEFEKKMFSYNDVYSGVYEGKIYEGFTIKEEVFVGEELV